MDRPLSIAIRPSEMARQAELEMLVNGLRLAMPQ
jgi:hypothetical protein